jgi:hypothetical protein
MADQIARKTTDVMDEIEVLIRARYPVIYVVTWEEARLEDAIAEIAAKREKRVLTWSTCRGVVAHGVSPQSRQSVEEKTRDPVAALDLVLDYVDPAVFIFKDFHPYFSDPAVARKVREVALYLKNSYKTLILVSPTLRLPLELQKEVCVVDFGLPGPEEIGELLDRTTEEMNKNAGLNIKLTGSQKGAIVNAALGLTINEAENVFAKTLVQTGGISEKDISIILSEKEQIIRKSGMLEYYRATEAFDNVGGMAQLKDWLRKRSSAFTAEARKFGLPAPKGVLLIGVPCSVSTWAGSSPASSGHRRRMCGRRYRSRSPSRRRFSGLTRSRRRSPARRVRASPTRVRHRGSSGRSSPGCRRRHRPFS